MTNIIFYAIQILAIPMLSPLVIGIVRKAKARFQNRHGASVLQPYRDLIKLFNKDEVISRDASFIFRFAPYIIFAVTLIVAASIPIFSTMFENNPISDFLTIIYITSISIFFLALAGMDTGSAFGGFGSSREMTMVALTEGGLIFSLFSLSFVAKSTNLFEIADHIQNMDFIVFAPLLLSFFAFIIAMLSETARFPFDNPATHLELTMIHEAMILEYSGKRLALIEWSSFNKFLIFLTLCANLFFPWGMTKEAVLAGGAIALVLFFVKILALALFVATLESSIAKFRFFKLPNLLLTSFVLSIVSIILLTTI